jgi:hypothetical protein
MVMLHLCRCPSCRYDKYHLCAVYANSDILIVSIIYEEENAMPRYSHEWSVDKNADQIAQITAQCLSAEGFKLTNINGEEVWKKGNGILAAPQFVAVKNSGNGTVLVEAWIKFAILPFVYGGEMDLSGFVGAVPKAFLKDRVNKLERMLVG